MSRLDSLGELEWLYKNTQFFPWRRFVKKLSAEIPATREKKMPGIGRVLLSDRRGTLRLSYWKQQGGLGWK